MAPRKKSTTVEQARHYLTGGAVTREDSDDELGYEDLPWEWIYQADGEDTGARNPTPRKRKVASAAGLERRIVGARMGNFQCKVGDAVLLKADGNLAWVGIISEFHEDEEEEEKMARFLWFSSEREIRNNAKKRTDFLKVCFIIVEGFNSS
jgi:origin recognition complex subunit 1